jgi:hypothetical protein
VLDQLLQQEVGALRPFGADDGGQRVQPLTGFLGVGVVGGGVPRKDPAQRTWFVS